MSEEQRQIHDQLRNAQDKYTYFLLAAAGAAIGLAINETQNSLIMWSQIPLAAAVLSWGLSFYFGCRHLGYISSILYSNFHLLQVKGGQHPTIQGNPELIGAASAGIREAIEINSERANRLGHLQFRFLIGGATLYLGWHLIEMWLRTAHAPLK
jgi:hypothetical protein